MGQTSRPTDTSDATLPPWATQHPAPISNEEQGNRLKYGEIAP
jgi:hypothetical protein